MAASSKSPAHSCKPIDTVLVSAVTAGRWEQVAERLNCGVSDTSHRWAVKIAGRSLELAALARFILPYSRDEHLDVLLAEVVRRGHWGTVGQLLKRRGVGDKEQRAWAVQEAGQKAKDAHLAALIIPWCDAQQVECLLKTAVDRGLWESVSLLLDRGISEPLQKWAIVEASKRADENPYTLAILRHCTDDQLESVLRGTIERGLWSCVGELLQHRAISDNLRTWAVESALDSLSPRAVSTQLSGEHFAVMSAKAAGGSELSDILQQCTDCQLEAALKVAVQKELWPCVGQLLQREMEMISSKPSSGEYLPELAREQANSGSYSPEDSLACFRGSFSRHLPQEFPLREKASTLHSWAIAQSFKHGSEADIIEHILSRCTVTETMSFLNIAMKRNMWSVAVTMILQPCFTETKRQAFFIKASKSADEDCLLHRVLPKCSSDYVGAALLLLVNRGFWRTVSVLLRRDGQEGISSDALKKIIAEKAIINANPPHLSLILPLCVAGQFRHLFLTALKKHRWAAVTVLLDLPTGETTSAGGIDLHESSKRSVVSREATCCMTYTPAEPPKATGETDGDKDSEKNMDRLTTEYQSVSTVDPHARCNDEHCVTVADVNWALDEVSKVASENVLITNILTKCTPNNVSAVLDIVLKRRLWKAVAFVLNRQDVSAAQLSTVFEVACKATGLNETFFIQDLDVGKFCPEAVLHTVLVTLVERGYWVASTRLLQYRDFQADDRGWVLEKASKEAKEMYVLKILNGGPVGRFQLHFVLHNLLQRCFWEAVLFVLARSRGTPDWKSLCVFAVENASTRASEHHLLRMLGYCPESSAERIMESLLKRCLWKAVALLLSMHRVSVCLCRRITEKASHSVDDVGILFNIVEYCPANLEESALATITKRKKWGAAGPLLSRETISVCDKVHFVKEALGHYGEASNEIFGRRDIRCVIMGMSMEHLDQVLADLIQSEQWHYIRLMLQVVHCDSLLETGTDRHVCLMATDSFGTTLLHILCASGFSCAVSALVNKGANPLQPSVFGRTLLCFAVHSEKYPEKMVAECLRLGLSTQQTTLTRQAQDERTARIEPVFTPSPEGIAGQHHLFAYINRLLFQGISLASPLECAMLRGSTVLMNALFESGVCTHMELCAIQLKTTMELPSDAPETARDVCECLEKMTNSVRSLKSACRLVISHCIGVGDLGREARVRELPLPHELQDYIQFSDLRELLMKNCGRSFKPDFDKAVHSYLSHTLLGRNYGLTPSLYYHNFMTSLTTND